MKTLLLDSSNIDLCVGIAINNELKYSCSYPCWQRQSEMMIPELEKGLKEMNLSLKDFDEVVCGIGPGSYTGVRIALTIAKTICTLLPIKLKVISSLRMMGNKESKYISLINARSSRSYIGVYDKENVVLKDTVMTNIEVREYVENHHEFEVIGDCSYIEISAKKPDILKGLLSLKDIVEPVEDVLSVKPVYLKD